MGNAYRIRGEATLTIDGQVFKIVGDDAERMARELADASDRVKIVPLDQPVSLSFQLDPQFSAKFQEWIDRLALRYPQPVLSYEPRRRRAQWKDEQARYGRRR